jgi:hypothetical protein
MMSSVGCEHRSVKVAAPVYPLPLRPRESASRARAAAAGARPRPGSRGRGAPACWAVAVACGRAAAARPVRRSRARRRTASACQLGRAGLLERKPTANFCASLPMALQHKKLGYGLTLPLAGVKRNTHRRTSPRKPRLAERCSPSDDAAAAAAPTEGPRSDTPPTLQRLATEKRSTCWTAIEEGSSRAHLGRVTSTDHAFESAGT